MQVKARAFDDNQSGVTKAMLRFAELLRDNGFNVGIPETEGALQVARLGLLGDLSQLKFALKAIFCSELEEAERFEKLFKLFWGRRILTVKNQRKIIAPPNHKNQQRTLVMMGEGEQAGDEKESKNVSGANSTERLRRTDFTKVEEVESALLEEIAEQLWKQMSKRLKRRMKASGKKSTIDLRRTIRQSIGQGGDPIDLAWKSKKPRKQRLVLLLDVSGSMDKYSFYLLKFICVLQEHFERVEAFIFSTNLKRITDYLNTPQLDFTLQLLSANVNNWSSGTKIGECFRNFNEAFAKSVLNGKSTTIILSDGLDTGEPDLLETELLKIKRRTDKLIWLNPLKAMQGYEPIQRGMSAALPQVDVFQSAHNLDSLLDLEKYLQDV